MLDKRCDSPTLLRRPGVSDVRSEEDRDDDPTIRGAMDIRCVLERVEGLAGPSRPTAKDWRRLEDIAPSVILRVFTMTKRIDDMVHTIRLVEVE